jgi:hypothetical protein
VYGRETRHGNDKYSAEIISTRSSQRKTEDLGNTVSNREKKLYFFHSLNGPQIYLITIPRRSHPQRLATAQDKHVGRNDDPAHNPKRINCEQFPSEKKAKHSPNQALGIPARHTRKQRQRGREGHEPRTGGRSKPQRWRLRSGGAPRRLLALLLQQQSPGPHRPIQERLTTLAKVTFGGGGGEGRREREKRRRNERERRWRLERGPGVVLKSVEHERPVRRRDEVAGPHKKGIHPRALSCAFRGHCRHFVFPHRIREAWEAEARARATCAAPFR